MFEFEVVVSYFSFLFILRGKFSYWVVSYFNRHILRLGGFHSVSCFLSSIGKLWADGGLRDLLVDSGVHAGNTAELILVGKEFNRDVRGFTLVFEAMQVLFIAAFIHWCRTFDYIDQIPSVFWNALFEFHRSICDQTIETSVLLTKVEELFEDHVQPLIGKFRKWGCDASSTFKYWDMFQVAVQLMLSNVEQNGKVIGRHIFIKYVALFLHY